MKREAINHTKMDRLMRRLKVPRCTAVGIMEMLWNFTARECPTGAIENRTAEDVAIACGWEGSEVDLLDALKHARFLEVHGQIWTVHDWPDHCDNSVLLKLWRERRCFADGNPPKVPATLLNSREREEYEKWYAKAAMDVHGSPVGPSLSFPSQASPSQAEPAMDAAPSAPLAFPCPKPKPPLEQDSDAGIGELRELWSQRAKTLASDEDWRKFERFWWRPKDFHQRRAMLEGARACEAPWFGSPLSWAEAGGWQRRDNPAVGQRAGPKTKGDAAVALMKKMERDLNAGITTEP